MNIYVKLLNEGTEVYRSVPAVEISTNTFKIGGYEMYNREDEEWEFPPGSIVRVQEKNSGNNNILIAVEVLT